VWQQRDLHRPRLGDAVRRLRLQAQPGGRRPRLLDLPRRLGCRADLGAG
jgi:hypothetical protein